MSTTIDRATLLAVMECPQWCESEHDHRDGPPYGFHDGPTFGGVLAFWQPLDPMVDEAHVWALTSDVGVYSETGQLNPSEARRLAADLVAAAQWLEAHQ